ncbi:MAG: bifunctional adenosylcobinamide kinase/adenosylcobinamide-phosphate guanylyltransferase, partial [Ruminococcus sp.]|nr:bifunctional adenosylcobinamide kinase/adenosylcobinamide-phosphate guanylyltransferase [Ruminococcus sp.]
MTTLITGGSKCGKSSYAEKLLGDFVGRKIYIATMQPFGEDALEAIERHRKMREGKGFETVEKYTDIHEISLHSGCAVLLECVGNLCANEMFAGGKITDPTDRIVRGIKRLARSVSELVIVTNQVGSDGITYPDGTAEYICSLGKINRNIAEFADNVIE